MSAKRFGTSCASVVCLGWLVSACATDVRPPHAGADGGDGGIRPAPADATSDGGACSGISQCGFPCPAGTVNPRDQNGCEHTCTCVLVEHASAGPVPLKMYTTCGDPVCGGPRANPGVPMCASSDVEGAPCRIEGVRCDFQSQCNQLLVCARKDPKTQVGGCPISRRSFKSDVHYLDASEIARYQQELLTMKLATWRYKHNPARRRLGFIIDDHESSVAVEDPGDRVDLYGYASLAVAALQRQAQQIAALEREVTLLKRALKEGPTPRNK
jgi:hypothetical protein